MYATTRLNGGISYLSYILMALLVIFSLSVLFDRWHGHFSNSESELFLCVLMNTVMAAVQSWCDTVCSCP